MAAESIYRSKRLVYVPIEKNELFINFLHELFQEPGMQNFTHSLPTGVPKSAIGGMIDSLASSRLLFMAACLPPPAPTTMGVPDDARRPAPTPIGVVSLTKQGDRMVQHATAALSTIFSTAHQRRGYGTEAIEWALDWGFDYARLHRVELSAYDWNMDAVRLYKKLGFRDEGVKREALWFRGAWHDMHELAILESEWRETRQGMGESE